MLKILVANQDTEQRINCSQFLTNDKNFIVENTSTGLMTLNAYLETKPNILILDTNFDDIKYTDILDRISLIPIEKKKCNTILTLNNPKEILDLVNTSKIYKIFNKPLDFIKIKDTINELKAYYTIDELTLEELDFILLQLDFNLKSNGTRYIESAILQCYYSPILLGDFELVMKNISNQYNVSEKTVREAIRSSLTPFNNSREYNHLSPIIKLFEPDINITPKLFLRTIVTYLHYKKQRQKQKDSSLT